MIRSVRYGVALATAILAFAFGAFGAPMIVSPADYSEIKTVSDRIWDDIHNRNPAGVDYFDKSTFYQSTYTGEYRQTAMADVATNSLPIKLQWVGSKGTSTVKLYRTRDLEKSASAEPLYTAQTEGSAITYFDPEVGRNYTWTVTDSTGATATGHFYTMQRTPRVIYADQNPYAPGAEASCGRDIGGWLTADRTKRVKQSLVYRSAELEYCVEQEGIVTPLKYLSDNLKVKLDIDLRTMGDLTNEFKYVGSLGWPCVWKNYQPLTLEESSIAPGIPRYCVHQKTGEKFPAYGSFESEKKAVWGAFNQIYQSVKKGETVLFHCSHGKDRTGSLAYVILGALGVDEQDARRDFAFTWYLEAKIDTYMKASTGAGGEGYVGLDVLKGNLDKYSGSTFKEDCILYLISCGKAAGDANASEIVADFQTLMLEDAETSDVEQCVSVAKPLGNSFVYTGAELTGVPEDERYTITGVSKATDIGSYTATLALKAGYTWEDGTTADIEVTWSITDLVAGSGIVRNAISDAGYTVTGLGKSGDEVAVVFTNCFNAYTWKVPKDLKYVKYLVVGGGGGGGGRAAFATSEYEGGAGGGGGGVVAGSIFSLKAGDAITVNVGAGGRGGDKSNSYEGNTGKGAASSGSDSSFKVNGENYVTAFGGGGDAGHGNTGAQGGSNAGNRGAVTTAQSYTAAGEIAPGAASLLSYAMYGNKGGIGVADAYRAAAGGGGAAEAGGNARKLSDTSYAAGGGGAGIVCDITGTRAVYGSGGGGGATSKIKIGYAGKGGEGAGDGAIEGVGTDGLPNQGGGGGGGALADDSNLEAKGGNGGSGIVVLRYSMNVQPEAETPVIASETKLFITYGDSVTRGAGASEVTMDDRKTYFGGRLKGVANVPESYPYWLSGFLSENYNVINQSRGSTIASHVSSWFGAQEVSVNAAITLPKSGSVTLNKKLVFNNCTYGNTLEALPVEPALEGFVPPIYPLSENYTAGTTSDSIVGTLGGYRVRIQGDDVTSLKVTALDTLAADVTIPAGSVFIPESATVDEYKNAVKIVCMGGNDWLGNRNGDYGDEDPYVYTYKTHIRPLALKLKSEGGRYLIVSPLFNPDGSNPDGDVASAEPNEVEKLYAADFGENYFNLRLAAVQNIERLAKELDIKINGDWSDFGGSIIKSDYVHLTSAGYKIKAALIREKLVSLGYITEVVKPVYTAEFAYDGSVKQCVPTGAGYAISGVNEASEIGEYKVLVTPEPGRVWTDGTTDPIEVTWTIAQLSAGGESFVLKVDAADGKLASGLGEGENEYAAIFTTSGKNIEWEVPTDLVNVQFLVVGGGGGGGAIVNASQGVGQGGAGGGGGGVVTGIVSSLSRGQKINIYVGKGGAGGTTTTETTVSNRKGVDPDGDGTDYGIGGAYSGEDSYFAVEDDEYVRAYGGGGDPGADSNGRLGGSNSGGRTTTAQGNPKKGMIGDAAVENIANYKIFGNKGGLRISSTPNAAGGGGGAGEAGKSATYSSKNQIGGQGGEGIVSSITGSEVVYGSGGAGGFYGNIIEGNQGGFGNKGGTGAGDATGETAKANQGGGGGGGTTYPKSPSADADPLDWKPENIVGGNGGSGIVVLRFSIPGADEKLKVAEIEGLIKNYIYDGSEHSCGLSDTDVRYTLSGVTKATEVGTYTVTVTVKDGWVWNDNNPEPSRSFTWTIAQATNEWVTEPSISKTAWDAGATVTYSIGSPKSGTPVTVTIKKDSVAFSGTLAAIKDWEPGFYSITFSVAETSGYTALTKTLTVNVTDPNEEIGEVTIDEKWGYITKPADNEYILVFTNHAATAMQWTAPAALQNVQFLVVGGGGGGGADSRKLSSAPGGTGGGGGGGGGVVTGLVNFAKGSVINVTVGNGGTGGKKGVATRNITFVGNDGETHKAYGDSGKAGDSLFSVGGNVYVRAYAGGGDLGSKGGTKATSETDSVSNAPEDGGSGSGARWKYRYGEEDVQSSATKGFALDDKSLIPYYKTFGNKGGKNLINYSAGGGGGATAAGGNTSSENDGNRTSGKGGEGLKCSITGTAVVYGSGGGGGSGISYDRTVNDVLGKGIGGKGGTGAGNGNQTPEGAGTSAKANQGGGGGGGGYHNNGGNGGSGIVVFRFTVDAGQTDEPEEELIAVAKPVVAETSFTYDGSAKSVVASNAGYTLVGNATATEAGNYTVTVKLNEGYVWSDNSTDDIVINWTIVATEEPFEPGVVQLGGNYGYVVPNVGGNANEYAVVFTNENAGTISWRAPADLENVEFLVVGGGGGGGGGLAYTSNGSNNGVAGCGGGGGGVVTGRVNTVMKQGSLVTIAVGKGGTAGKATNDGSYVYTSLSAAGDGNGKAGNGGDSSLTVDDVLLVKAVGGGGDGGLRSTGQKGGSNSGSRTKVLLEGTAANYTNGLYVTARAFGNRGGKSVNANTSAGSAGGGGATDVGADEHARGTLNGSTTYYGGNGGAGLTSTITGSSKVYGSGGGGGVAINSDERTFPGKGGEGAGDGMWGLAVNYEDDGDGPALPNQGGGGGGGGRLAGTAGGSGIVVLRFSMPVVIETVKIAKPVAVTSFTYDGAEKTALTSGEGYELSGTTKAVDAGSYTATATLKSGYAWSDDTTEAITFNWSIAKATNSWNTKPAITKTSWYTDEDAATLTLGAAKFGEVVASMTKDGEEVAFSETLPTEAGNYTITFTVADSNNYGALAETITFTVIQASPVKINGEYGYVVPGLGVDGNEYAVVFTNHLDKAMTWTTPAELKNVQFLVVGGGGGGGADVSDSDGKSAGAGGGGGGVVTGLVNLAKGSSITVSVGNGGLGGKVAKQGVKVTTFHEDARYKIAEPYGNVMSLSENSSFAINSTTAVIAYGGGGDQGANREYEWEANVGGDGGSGAGTRVWADDAPGVICSRATRGYVNGGLTEIVYSEMFGEAGGTHGGYSYVSGGGGGATQAGAGGTSSLLGGAGGQGLVSDITGEKCVYGSGGGGGSVGSLAEVKGGVAGTGAGNGNEGPGLDGCSALPNQGGGGGGGGGQANGGNGGSGIVVLRFSLEEEGETPEVPPTPASDWGEIPSLSKKIFNAGTAITVFNGTCENRTITANYTADQIAALNPGTYTFRATASAAGVEPLVYEIDFWVLPADFSAANTIVCYGDSITYGDGAAKITIDDRGNYFDGRLKGENIKANYPYYLAGMIDTKYNVIAQAKPQQWSDTILAWAGGVDVVTRNALTLPASGSTVWAPTNLVFTAANPYGINGGLQYVRDIEYPNVQTNYFAGAQMPALPAVETRPNPAGSASSMTGWLGDKRVRVYGKTAHPEFYDGATTADYAPDQEWARISAGGSAVEIPAGTPFVPDTALVYNDAISVIFTGTNDEMGKKYWPENNAKDHTTYISMIADTVAKIPSGRYVVVSTLSINQRSDEIESAFAAEFGEHHLNLYKLMELYGLKTAVKLGIMTQAQADATTWDTKTTGLMNESVHPNEKGYQVIAYFLKQKLIELKYIEGERDDDISFSYVAKPAVDVTSFTYDGAEKVVVVEGENYTVTGTAKVTNAGSYTATITPNAGFGWADGTSGAVTINWTIAKATNAWTTEPSITLTEWTVGDAPGVLTAGVAKFGNVAVTINGEAFTQMPTDVGTYEVTYSVADSTNYTALTKTIAFTIKAAPVEPDPEEPGTGGDEGEGEEPKLEIDSAVGYIVRDLGELKDQVAVVFTNANNYSWTMPKSAKNVEFLVVGGGGGGGGHYKGTETKFNQGGSGGGGGAVVIGFVNNIAAGAAMTINVGEGGEGGVAASGTTTDGLSGANGGNSYFKVGDVTYITAYGGGGDGGFASPGVAVGGSNSGSRGRYDGSAASITATALAEVEFIGAGADVSNVVYMRNKGTAGYETDSGAPGGGGGGAVSEGIKTKGSGSGSDGGAGYESGITGESKVYGSGGGSGLGKSVAGGAEIGKGGIGAGSGYADENGGDALANQGGGGGGGSYGKDGGDGGSGIIVLRFAYSEKDIVVDADTNVKPKISSKAYTGSALTSGIVNTYAYTVKELTDDLINVGKKTVRVILNDGYVWSDGDSNKSKEFDWYIAEVEPMENGYKVVGLGEKGNEVARVYTNHTATINWTVPANLKNVQFLVVGGGGGGGADNVAKGDDNNYQAGGGGGGGGVIAGSVNLVKDETVTIKIGAGGKGGVRADNASPYGGVKSPAENSFFKVGTTVVTADAGGGDPGSTVLSGLGGGQTGGDGGSSSGSRSGATDRGEATCGKVEDADGKVVSYSPFGNEGGAGFTYYQAGGGGGATAEGEPGSANFGGNGGEGIAYDITGTMVVYGSGGGGGAVLGAAIGAGVGGSGAGNGGHTAVATSALANQGGGGGGAGRVGNGGNGGSGIVVFRYVIPPEVNDVPIASENVFDEARVLKPIWYPVEPEKSTDDSGATVITYDGVAVKAPEYYNVEIAPAEKGGYNVSLTLNDLATPRIANRIADGEVETPAIKVEGGKVVIHLEGTYPALKYTIETSDAIGAGAVWEDVEVADGGEDSEGKGSWLNKGNSDFEYKIGKENPSASRFFRVGAISDE